VHWRFKIENVKTFAFNPQNSYIYDGMQPALDYWSYKESGESPELNWKEIVNAAVNAS